MRLLLNLSLDQRKRVGLALSVAAYCSLCLTSIAVAFDNPFGLPHPLDPDKPGAVLLHGGGYLSNDPFREQVRSIFVELAGGRNQEKILIMPSNEIQRGLKDLDGRSVLIDGGETRLQFEQRLGQNGNYGQWIEACGKDAFLGFVYHDSDFDPDHTKLVEQINQATGIWLPANDQNWLPDLFANEYPKNVGSVVNALRNLISRGGVVGGLGGGMSCFPDTMIAENLPDDGGWIKPRLRFGMGLLDGIVIDKDFTEREGRLERLTYLLRSEKREDRSTPGIDRRTIGIGVSHSNTAILKRNQIEAIGDGGVQLFLKSNGDRTITWYRLSNGQSLTIQSSSAWQNTEANGRQFKRQILNPFGLPESDGSPSGTVVLHGGGSTNEILEQFPEFAGTPQPHMVHCPAADLDFVPIDNSAQSKISQKLNEYFHEWRTLESSRRLSSLVFLTTNNPRDADSGQFVEPLKSASAVWFSGGDQNHLSHLFLHQDKLNPTKFQEELFGVLKRGGVVGGTSAGLAILPATSILRGTDDSTEKAVLSRGFGVLKNVLAEQHFEARQGRIKRMTDLLWDNHAIRSIEPGVLASDKIGIAVEERTALVVQGNRIVTHGTQFGHIFLKSKEWEGKPSKITWHRLRRGDVAVIQYDSKGEYSLELEEWHAN